MVASKRDDLEGDEMEMEMAMMKMVKWGSRFRASISREEREGEIGGVSGFQERKNERRLRGEGKSRELHVGAFFGFIIFIIFFFLGYKIKRTNDFLGRVWVHLAQYFVVGIFSSFFRILSELFNTYKNQIKSNQNLKITIISSINQA